MPTLPDFVRESNAIEGIHRDPTERELAALDNFLCEAILDVGNVCTLQAIFAPGKPLRELETMNVRVGSHIAPRGGPQIAVDLAAILHDARFIHDPWEIHRRFETLHPFMDGNGRTGRAIWAWQMEKLGRDPFALSFLHRWYYQTLEHSR